MNVRCFSAAVGRNGVKESVSLESDGTPTQASSCWIVCARSSLLAASVSRELVLRGAERTHSRSGSSLFLASLARSESTTLRACSAPRKRTPRALPNHDFLLVKVRQWSRLPCKASRAADGWSSKSGRGVWPRSSWGVVAPSLYL